MNRAEKADLLAMISKLLDDAYNTYNDLVKAGKRDTIECGVCVGEIRAYREVWNEIKGWYENV